MGILDFAESICYTAGRQQSNDENAHGEQMKSPGGRNSGAFLFRWNGWVA
jgi:hypothetical protein